MQKSKKQLLGMGGLAMVVAGTAYAVSIPSPDADAASGVAGNVNLQVMVYSGDPEIKITSISDGEVTLDGNITIGNLYSDANKIEYFLYKKTSSGNVDADLGANAVYIPSDQYGTHEFQFNLDSDPNLSYGEYVVKAVLTSGGPVLDTQVSFSYVPLEISYVGKTENGNPIVEINYSAGVSSIDLNALDSKGKAAFDSDLNYPVGNPGVAGTMRVTLPFSDYGVSSGDYEIGALGRGANGAVLYPEHGPFFTTASYVASPSNIEVPKTGDVIAKLNISRVDYLVTGLIGFSLVTIAAFYLLRKKRR